MNSAQIYKTKNAKKHCPIKDRLTYIYFIINQIISKLYIIKYAYTIYHFRQIF